jgi:hypothetical protein
MTDSVGGISAVKTKILELISASSSNLSPQATHVHPNWKTDISYLETNFPVVTVRLGPANISEKVYGRQLGNDTRGTYTAYALSMHVWDERASTDPASKNACDLADTIINYLLNYTGDSTSGIVYFDALTVRESEPDPRGPQRLCRVIIEGFVFCKRILSYELTLSVISYGTTSPTAGAYSEIAMSTVSVTYTPSGHWDLDHWELDGVDVGDDNPYTVTMDSSHTLEAIEISSCGASGNRVTNGDFELGALTNWTATGDPCGAGVPIISTTQKRDSYSVELPPNDDCDLYQDLDTPTAVSCIDSCSFWLFGYYHSNPCMGQTTKIKVIITYDDATTDEFVHTTTVGEDQIWVEVDILSHLDPTKTVETIEFTRDTGQWDHSVYVDDVTLVVA